MNVPRLVGYGQYTPNRWRTRVEETKQAYRTARMKGALSESSTDTAIGTCAPPKDRVNTNCSWYDVFENALICCTGISTPETIMHTWAGVAAEADNPVTITFRMSPAAAELPESAMPEALFTAVIVGGGASIWIVTGNALTAPLLNRTVAGPAGKPPGTTKLTCVAEAAVTCTGISLRVTCTPPAGAARFWPFRFTVL